MPDQRRPERTVILQDEGLRSLGGFTQIPNVILKHAKLSFGAKVAFGVLLSYAWQDDFCYPAQERMAADLNCSARHVRNLLQELKKARIIDWKQLGLNRPNIYYLLPQSRWSPANSSTSPDRKTSSCPARKPISVQERNHRSDKEYTAKNIQDVNVNDPIEPPPDPAREDHLVVEILDVCGDRHSAGMYRRIARVLPEQVIFSLLSETRYAANMGRIKRTRGAHFTASAARFATENGYDLGTRSSQ